MEHNDQAPHSRTRIDSTFGDADSTVTVTSSTTNSAHKPQRKRSSSAARQQSSPVQQDSPYFGTWTLGGGRPLSKQEALQNAPRPAASEERRANTTAAAATTMRGSNAVPDSNRRRSLTLPTNLGLPTHLSPRRPVGQPPAFSHCGSASETLQRPTARRQLSSEVQEREQNLRDELDELKEKLRGHEEKRLREMISISFAVNRIIEQQKNQMKTQTQLLERLENMDLEAVEEAKAKLARLQNGELSDSSRSTGVRSNMRGSVNLQKRQGEWEKSQGEASSSLEGHIEGHTHDQQVYEALAKGHGEGCSQPDGSMDAKDDIDDRPK